MWNYNKERFEIRHTSVSKDWQIVFSIDQYYKKVPSWILHEKTISSWLKVKTFSPMNLDEITNFISNYEWDDIIQDLHSEAERLKKIDELYSNPFDESWLLILDFWEHWINETTAIWEQEEQNYSIVEVWEWEYWKYAIIKNEDWKKVDVWWEIVYKFWDFEKDSTRRYFWIKTLNKDEDLFYLKIFDLFEWKITEQWIIISNNLNFDFFSKEKMDSDFIIISNEEWELSLIELKHQLWNKEEDWKFTVALENFWKIDKDLRSWRSFTTKLLCQQDNEIIFSLQDSSWWNLTKSYLYFINLNWYYWNVYRENRKWSLISSRCLNNAQYESFFTEWRYKRDLRLMTVKTLIIDENRKVERIIIENFWSWLKKTFWTIQNIEWETLFPYVFFQTDWLYESNVIMHYLKESKNITSDDHELKYVEIYDERLNLIFKWELDFWNESDFVSQNTSSIRSIEVIEWKIVVNNYYEFDLKWNPIY